MSWDDKRPMSPHIQIYKMPITATLSILHRGTGVVLFIGLLLMVWVLAAVAGGVDSWQTMQHFLSSWLGQFVLLGFTFSLYYHLCNGMRHLLWDTGKGLSLKSVHFSALVVLIASAVLTLLTWIIA